MKHMNDLLTLEMTQGNAIKFLVLSTIGAIVVVKVAGDIVEHGVSRFKNRKNTTRYY